ncbi:uncharacterized protein LOC127810504 isoform X2 [Diospyros lotus]|uniref:uncharacterized protein LOC127810504 isoform X2 n=1 Tax=Diospyros lotus TaxID=55363 RepID=UPI002258891A|nr:uncharacterized protein LOC127810504 isoform X2 [Diospyros lotus]
MSIMAKSSAVSYKVRSLVTVLCWYRIRSSRASGSNTQSHQGRYLSYGAHSPPEGLRVISSAATRMNSDPSSAADETSSSTVKIEEEDEVQPSVPQPPPKTSFSTIKWLLASMLSLALPFLKKNWANFLLIEGEVEGVVEEAEMVAEVVEKVATTTEKISAEVVCTFPDNAKLKEAALLIEHASSVTAKDAEHTKDFIHKVEELKHDLTDMGTIVEPVIDNIIAKQHHGK